MRLAPCESHFTLYVCMRALVIRCVTFYSILNAHDVFSSPKLHLLCFLHRNVSVWNRRNVHFPALMIHFFTNISSLTVNSDFLFRGLWGT